MGKHGYSKAKKRFLSQVSHLFSSPFTKERHRQNHGLQRHIVAAAQLFGFEPSYAITPPTKQQVGRCHFCSTVSRTSCDKSRRFACLRQRACLKENGCFTCVPEWKRTEMWGGDSKRALFCFQILQYDMSYLISSVNNSFTGDASNDFYVPSPDTLMTKTLNTPFLQWIQGSML